MTAPATSSPDFMCVPGTIPAEQRAAHFALAADLFRKHAEERIDLPDGYGFRFATEIFEELARFVANERKCCPAISFSIVTTPESGPVWLYMQGPEGVHDFLKAELPIQKPPRGIPVIKHHAVFLGASVAAGIATLLGCCGAPLLFVMAGLGGTWLVMLHSFESFRPLFIVAALAGLAFAYRQIFRARAACEPATVCADKAALRQRKVIFWLVATLVAGLIVSSYVMDILL